MEDNASPPPTPGEEQAVPDENPPVPGEDHAVPGEHWRTWIHKMRDDSVVKVPTRSRTEVQLRRLASRKSPYTGQILAITRGWVSRDGKMHAFAARFLDFAMLTPEHLLLCSTGFFTRRPRHQVLREPLNRLVVVPRGPEPIRTLRIYGDFHRALLLELRADPESLAFAADLLARTRRDSRVPAPPDEPA